MALALTKTNRAQSSFEVRDALEAGTYDAVLSAVVDLEIQVNDFDSSKPKLEHQIKFLFEIPEHTQEIEGKELPIILSKDVQISTIGERNNFYLLVNAIRKTKVSVDEVIDMPDTDGAIKSLLGKALVLQVDQYETKHKDSKGNPIKRNKISGFSPLRASKNQPEPVREPFIFEVASPNLNVFRDNLSKWTRDKIMTAENNDEFPAELHKAYRDIKEAEAQKSKKD